MTGYDVFFEQPGTVTSHTCRGCGAECIVERNRVGPTSWAGAMGKVQTPHDYFRCPNAGKDWHERAIDLVQRIEDTPSKRVTGLMQQDLIDILKENGCAPDNPEV